MGSDMRISILGLLVAGLAFAPSCNGDDATDGTANDETAGDDDDDDDSDDDDDADETADGDDDDDDSDGPCGNGVVDPGEQCDDGADNSDTTPDACRTDCRLPQCNDGVIDVGMGEECDDGGSNADFEPNACRTNCLLPRCGDGGVDTGESCDDGNEEWGDSCYECSQRFYFILNGDASILRTTRDGEPVQIVASDASYSGLRALAVEPDGTTVYALQSDGATDRVLLFSGLDGTLQSEVDIGMAALGYDPDAGGIVRASDGLVYVALTGGGSTRLVSIDPAGGGPTEAVDFGSTFEIADVTDDGSSGVYITTGPGNSVMRADIGAGTSATFASGLSNPQGIAYEPDDDIFWVANTPSPVDIMEVDGGGNVSLFTTASEDLGAQIPALAVDTGGVITAVVPSQDRLVGIALLGGVQTLFDDMVTSPQDVVIVELPDRR